MRNHKTANTESNNVRDILPIASHAQEAAHKREKAFIWAVWWLSGTSQREAPARPDGKVGDKAWSSVLSVMIELSVASDVYLGETEKMNLDLKLPRDVLWRQALTYSHRKAASGFVVSKSKVGAMSVVHRNAEICSSYVCAGCANLAFKLSPDKERQVRKREAYHLCHDVDRQDLTVFMRGTMGRKSLKLGCSTSLKLLVALSAEAKQLKATVGNITSL